MKMLSLLLYIAFCVHLVRAQSEPIVIIDNVILAHESKGWRVLDAPTPAVSFNLIKGDRIIRIDGKNAAETGPMLMASLLNQGNRRQIDLFIVRGDSHMQIELRTIRGQDLDPVGSNPFKHVAKGFSAPDVAFNDLEGQPRTLEQFKDRWLLIHFTATWCAPCMNILPFVVQTAEHNDLSLNLLTVALNDRAEAVRRMQKRYQIESPIVLMKAFAELPVDFGITTNRWSGQIPALVLLRPDGEVALIDIGDTDAEHLKKMIECQLHCNADEVLKSVQLKR